MRFVKGILIFSLLCVGAAAIESRTTITLPSYAEAAAVTTGATVPSRTATATNTISAQARKAVPARAARQAKAVPRVAGAAAAPKTTPYDYMRLFYYRGGRLAKKSFLAHPNAIDIFAPQAYGLYDTGELKGSVDPELLAFAQKHHIKVMPLVTNDGFSHASYQAILNDSVKQQEGIDALVSEAKKNGYWGWQIDFEQMDVSYRAAFSTFVKHAAETMHANGLKLSVAVFAQHSENPGDYTNNLWQNAIGVYDYEALASSVDFVSIMSYDDPVSTGPPAEWSWYKDILAFSLSKMPADKISLGIPLYYWLWNDTTGERVEAGGNAGIQHVFNTHAVAVRYSAKEHVPYLHFWKKGVGYTLWYENAQSVAQKIALIKKNKLYGFSAWTLGLERPVIWPAVK